MYNCMKQVREHQRWKKSKLHLGSLLQCELLSARRGNSIARIGRTEVSAPFAERNIRRPFLPHSDLWEKPVGWSRVGISS